MADEIKWEWEINKRTTWLGASLRELYQFKDLLFRLVRKDFLSSYQQTLLGPFWVLLQPILTVLTSVLIFSKIIGVSTDGVPPLLYYLAGITLWNLFSEIFLATAVTFTQNAQVFSKVYFPRIIVPLSVVMLSGLRFLIQLLLLFIALMYYYFTGDISLPGSIILLAIPVVIATAGIGLGAGLIFSIFTAKYRDFLGLLQIILRLLMFVCPIFYPMSIVPQKLKWIMSLNPLSTQFELFRYAVLGKGLFTTGEVLYSMSFMVILVAGGLLLFNKIGDKLIDVV
ncbi:ABC transporter permease [Paraflavitalea sp. CAU 1676]|uniref:ABC transporter permease n=1 Tax=Paraflavitalea sp. CAU 1676 TaxID=3032598 RepID=UPI0023DB17FF|nr:ABC transporter permease [Paraflavitalea sp. CAU 1676]MDF2188464.1 ABC transporter permease [Paraflavitalea sp. CAU 1676]